MYWVIPTSINSKALTAGFPLPIHYSGNIFLGYDDIVFYVKGFFILFGFRDAGDTIFLLCVWTHALGGRRTLRNCSMASKQQELTHNEIWDDSALIDSWDQALEEYKVPFTSPSSRPRSVSNPSHRNTIAFTGMVAM